MMRAGLRGAVALAALLAALACREGKLFGRRPAPLPERQQHGRAQQGPEQLGPGQVGAVPVQELCFTSGSVRPTADRRWVNEASTLRAVAPNSAGRRAALVFRYLGNTREQRRLGSGAERRQVGLKLLSRDTCNVVYAMWRFGERWPVVAAIKSNPGLARHAQCGNRGYRTLKPLWRARVPEPEIGSVHELSATIRGRTLELRIDDEPVLQAALDPELGASLGSSGLRSDNVRFELLRFDADLTGGRQGCSR